MNEQPQGASESSTREPRISQPLYTRPMPGGGYVRVELVESDESAVGAEHLRGRVVMERRTPAPATPEEEHMVVEDLEGDDPNVIMAELFRIARDNAAIARRVLRRQQPIQRTD
ncbi:MAG: hypothetical protein JWL61_1040 [Gemmatimonadetes bacterium]|jgi:hypothetical protein|nr:hypothetical protein [Gemmatimonadota bacterium]